MATKQLMRPKEIKDQMLVRMMPLQLTRIPGRRLTVRAAKECDCRVKSAVHAWRSQTLGPAFNSVIDFGTWMSSFGVSAKKRLVIEFVTAEVRVPAGEMARLRMYTGLGSTPSNHDLAFAPQGVAGGQQVLVATHNIRAYTDHSLSFNVNRDNATTSGYALVCISGYLETMS